MSAGGTPGTKHQRLLAAIIAEPGGKDAPVVQTEIWIPPVHTCDWDEM
jgi:hypothetical protein